MILTFLCGCFFSVSAQSLTIKIYNKTGHSLDSLQIGEKHIGHIEKDSVTELNSYSRFSFDTGFPNEYSKGLIGPLHLSSRIFGFFGSELSSETKGTFIFDLLLTGAPEDRYIFLDYHQN